MPYNTTISVDPSIARSVPKLIGQILETCLVWIMGPNLFSKEFMKITGAPNGCGDFSFVCFKAAKTVGVDSTVFAKELAEKMRGHAHNDFTSIEASGPYVNFTLDRELASRKVIDEVLHEGTAYGQNDSFGGKTMLVEFLSPNTNKPLHIGHLRNGILGTAVANLLSANGATVIRANNINDRGIHIVQSMLAYQLWGEGETPESAGEKGDHFVGRYYVLFHKAVATEFEGWLKDRGIDDASLSSDEKDKLKEEFKKTCALILKTQEMLSQWEKGSAEIVLLWQKMNQWVYDGFDETNSRIGFFFDKVYHESETYKLGRSMIHSQLAKGICQQAKDESVVIDLTGAGLGDKPISLLRRDGTSLYITQDIGLAETRFQQIDGLTGCVYVVAREQEFHFRVLFEILRLFGYEWWKNLYHLSYGMINLPSGKMKSREGTVVDADDLMDQLRDVVADIIIKGDQGVSIADVKRRAEQIAQGALKYMLMSMSPKKDIMFDPQKSVNFTGNTGPYLQYACVRINAIAEKSAGLPTDALSREINNKEFELIKLIGLFPELVQQAAIGYDPSVLAGGLHEIAKAFSAFYAECPVVYNNRVDEFRLELCCATRQVLSNGLALLGIAVPDKM